MNDVDSAGMMTGPHRGGDGMVSASSVVLLPDISWQNDGDYLVCVAVGAGGINVSLSIQITVDGKKVNRKILSV